MSKIELYNCLYNKLTFAISEIDPGNLGGAEGEYDKDINEIIRITIDQKRQLSTQELREIFRTYTGDFAALSDDDINTINKLIIDCITYQDQ